MSLAYLIAHINPPMLAAHREDIIRNVCVFTDETQANAYAAELNERYNQHRLAVRDWYEQDRLVFTDKTKQEALRSSLEAKLRTSEERLRDMDPEVYVHHGLRGNDKYVVQTLPLFNSAA